MIIVNDDLGMSPGKVASQAAHAAVAAALEGKWADVAAWRAEGPTKIVLRATEKEMIRVAKIATKHKLNVVVFIDEPPTTEGTAYKMTAMAIGPHPKDLFVKTKVTGKLKLY